MKICIIGGGSTYTPELIEGLVHISDTVRIDEIYMLDIEESREKFAIVSAFAQRMLTSSKSSIVLKTGYDPEQAIKGADYLLFQFRGRAYAGTHKR